MTNSSDKQLLDYQSSYQLLEQLLSSSSVQPEQQLSLDSTRHTLSLSETNGEEILRFRLPSIFPAIRQQESGVDAHGVYHPVPTEESVESYFSRLSPSVPSYLILLMQAGHSALGTFVDGENVHHKVIQKYMVRKKQGKAQLTHLNTKGKSRAGSRIRLQNTVHFFEEINQKLDEWDIVDEMDKLLYACTPRLWSLLFTSKCAPPFEKDDPRLHKLPVDTKKPNFKELLRIHYLAQRGEVISKKSVDFGFAL